MTKLMFLCTGNSCRSQMAEGYARKFGGGEVEVFSAGLFPAGINPYAMRVMKEDGIDISGQSSDPIDPDLLNAMDIIITLCGNAEARCPTTPPHIERLHWPVDDPVGSTGTEEQILSEFRKARDIVRDMASDLIQKIKGPS